MTHADKIRNRTEILKEVLNSDGPMPLHAIDNGLVKEMSEIIGALYRLCEIKGCTHQEIEYHVINNI